MRVLIVTPNPPYPPQQGAALRNYGLLHSLARSGAKITLLTFCESTPEHAPERLAALCERIDYVPAPSRTKAHRLRDLVTTPDPDLARRLHSEAFQRRLTQLLHETDFDVVQFEGLEVAAYAPIVRNAQPQAALIYDAHNAEFALQGNIAQVESASLRRLPAALYSRTQAQRMMQFEKAICEKVNGVIAVSDDDAAHLRKLGTKTPIFTLPNGIFVDEYAPVNTRLDLVGMPLVFTGKMDYRPNVDAILWFAQDIFPKILKENPQTHLYVVGQAVHDKLLQLQETTSNIAFTRWVESVVPFLHHAKVFVAPLRMGSGTRLKILEAMAAGCTIVATSVAISGLQESARKALVVADTEDHFSAEVNRLLKDDAARKRLGQAARNFVSECYDWSVLAPQLQTIYADLGIAKLG